MRIALTFQETAQQFPMDVENLQIIHEGTVPPYTGEYTVTPLAASAVILETEGLRMTDDVTVRKIPYYETSNPGGGYTAYIASEV